MAKTMVPVQELRRGVSNGVPVLLIGNNVRSIWTVELEILHVAL